MSDNSALESVYREHHEKRRGHFFVILEDIRGGFLRSKIGTGKKIIDIGCRDGALVKNYLPGNEVLGLDIDSQALERAKTSLGIETKCVDLNGDWGVPAGSFDVAVAAEVLEHIYYPATVVDKLVATLKSDGFLVGGHSARLNLTLEKNETSDN